jgi:hypothetical protein
MATVFPEDGHQPHYFQKHDSHPLQAALYMKAKTWILQFSLEPWMCGSLGEQLKVAGIMNKSFAVVLTPMSLWGSCFCSNATSWKKAQEALRSFDKMPTCNMVS